MGPALPQPAVPPVPPVMRSVGDSPVTALPEPTFGAPPARLVTRPVHVWRFVSADRDPLSDTEREHADKFQSEPARTAFVTGRSGIRRAAAIYTGMAARDLVVSQTPSGKPFFANAEIHFNLSHSGGEVVAAFSSEPVGLDIESSGRCRDFAEIARRFFHPEDAALISREDDFLRHWTGKEAILKLVGCGLSGGLERARTTAAGEGMLDGRRVWIEGFRMGSHRGSVASFQTFEVKGWFQI